MGFLEMRGGPTQVAALGAILGVEGETCADKSSRAAEGQVPFEGAQTWGTDQTGAAIEKNYWASARSQREAVRSLMTKLQEVTSGVSYASTAVQAVEGNNTGSLSSLE